MLPLTLPAFAIEFPNSWFDRIVVQSFIELYRLVFEFFIVKLVMLQVLFVLAMTRCGLGLVRQGFNISSQP